MYVDLLDSNNYLLVNVSLIEILGLKGAVYCSELFSIIKKAVTKNKLVEDACVKVDRAYIQKRTSLTPEEQIQIEDSWAKSNLISKLENESNVFSVNVPAFIGLISGQSGLSEKELGDLKKSLAPKSTSKSKKEAICERLKDSVVCENVTIKDGIFNWIETMVKTEGLKPLNKTAVQTFVRTLLEYVKDDEKVALKLLEIATIQCFRDCSWAINRYEKDLKAKSASNFNAPRTTTQKRATKSDMENGEVF